MTGSACSPARRSQPPKGHAKAGRDLTPSFCFVVRRKWKVLRETVKTLEVALKFFHKQIWIRSLLASSLITQILKARKSVVFTAKEKQALHREPVDHKFWAHRASMREKR